LNNKKYEYIIDGDVVYINFYQRDGTKHTTIIDLEQLDKVLNYEYSWGVAIHKSINKYYVVTTTYNKNIDERNKRYNICRCYSFNT